VGTLYSANRFDLRTKSDLVTELAHCCSVVLQYGDSVIAPPPFPFGHICFAVLVMRKGGESSWSGPWHLGCTLEVSMCTATRTSWYSPVGPTECVLFSLSLYFVCLYCFNLFVCPHHFMFPWAVESSPLQVLALA